MISQLQLIALRQNKTMLQSTDFDVMTLENSNASVLVDNFYLNESVEQKLNLELDFGTKTKSAETCGVENTSSIPHHILVAPVHYEAGYSYPLFVWLHDSGADERQVVRLMPQISLRNYVAVAPRGKAITAPSAANSNLNINDDWDDYSINAVIQRNNRNKISYDWFLDNDGISEAERSIFDSITVAKKSCNIAENRVFIAGVGNGGAMAMRLALLYPKYFAGVAIFNAVIPDNANIFCHWNTARNLSIFIGLEQQSDENFSSSALSNKLDLFYSAGFKLTVRDYKFDSGKPAKDLPKQILQEL
ncbi:MAG: hypothetical protein LBB88_11415, partial [Planctomycetaceae bacterium]|nr:hypothetical protein [Planctomycetaceae bacterium]